MSSAWFSRREIVRGITSGLAMANLRAAQTIAPDAVEREQLPVGKSELEVIFSAGHLDASRSDVVQWVNRSAAAVADYFGRFPVPQARLAILPRQGRQGVFSGRTWGEGGAHTRLSLGEHTTVDDLKHDWMLTHEFVHYGFPDMPDRNHWIEEGLATYVEPIARVSVGTQDAATAWFEMLRDMPQGQPQAGDLGLDHTHTWGRTYWGGAAFCLLADVTIRRHTKNAKGLRDALRAIVAGGGNIEVQWPIERALALGDQAVGGNTLATLYDQMSGKAVTVDLDALWKELGVERRGDTAVFHDDAPLAAVRRAILS